MKKILAILLAVTMLASMATVVSAAENTTTLTTNVPAATYTLNIPADQKIEFGATSTDIGNVTVTDASGFAYGKNLQVTIEYGAFTCEGVSTTIPFSLRMESDMNISEAINLASGDSFTFLGKSDGTVYEEVFLKEWPSGATMQRAYVDNLFVRVSSTDWGKALAGEYTATITYTAEVVVE